MPLSLRKPTVQVLAWYASPGSSYCRLVQLDHELTPCPTPEQEGLIIYPEQDPVNAGRFFASNGGQFHNLN
jgi:hypothetical protein